MVFNRFHKVPGDVLLQVLRWDRVVTFGKKGGTVRGVPAAPQRIIRKSARPSESHSNCLFPEKFARFEGECMRPRQFLAGHGFLNQDFLAGVPTL